MKRSFFLLTAAAALLVGMSACDKDTEGGVAGDPTGTGSMKITLDFTKSSGNSSTYAAPTASTAKPSTSWQDNIKSLAVFFVDKASGEIKNAQSVPFEANANLAEQTKVVKGVPVGTYDVYVFANWDQGGKDWSVATAKGRKIQDLYMTALENADYAGYKHQTSEANSKGYVEAPEVFVAMHSGIAIPADNTFTDPDAYKLTRIVSLVRVRIDQSVGNDQNKNNIVSFQDAMASLRIRRIKTGINLMYTDATMSTTTNRAEAEAKDAVFFAKGAFGDAEPATGYSQGTILTDNFTSWKDVKLIPTGSETVGAEKLDIVITGITTEDGYVPAGYPKQLDGQLVESAPKGSQIAWAAAISHQLKGNGIMELNLTLLSAGQWVDPTDPDKPLPEPQEYGNLELNVGLVDWGAIEQVNIEM